jgi:PAS domain-containing protein
MLGYEDKNDIIGTRIFDYAPVDRREDWRFLQQKLWASLTPSFSLETCLLRKDGALIWCQVSTFAFDVKVGVESQCFFAKGFVIIYVF